nr:MAG TPA: Transcriptional regulator FleQ factor, AAA+, ATPase, c-di-GMP [Caudoviricetes sp.]
MKKEENLNKMAFRDYYDTLSDDAKEAVRSRILEESGMSYTTFYYKLRNNTFKPLERKLIDNIINDVNPKVLC